jgi:diguanylate cyclase (GGDEF)-like protein
MYGLPPSLRPPEWRIDRRAALEVLVRIARWPRLAVAATGALTAAGLLVLDYLTGPQIRPELLYVALIVAVAWAGYALDAVAGAAMLTLLRVIVLDHPSTGSVGHSTAQGVLTFGGLALVIGITAWLRDAVLEADLRGRMDPLTGVLNGPAFRERAEEERERTLRTGGPITLVFFDLDDFKHLNDRRGHQAGDEVLVQFAQCVRRATRPYDAVGRVGGDEFVILLPGADAATARDVVMRIQRRTLTPECPVRFSAGIATYLRPPESVDEMFREADGLMYAAKRAGGGRPVGRVIAGPQGFGEMGLRVEDPPAVPRPR